MYRGGALGGWTREVHAPAQNRAAPPRTASTTSREANPSMAARPLSISASGEKMAHFSRLAEASMGMREAVMKVMAASRMPAGVGKAGRDRAGAGWGPHEGRG